MTGWWRRWGVYIERDLFPHYVWSRPGVGTLSPNKTERLRIWWGQPHRPHPPRWVYARLLFQRISTVNF